MTEIDKDAEIDIVWKQQQATVRIPLAGHASQEWSRRYRALARRKGLEAWAEDHQSRGWVIIGLPESAGPEEIGEMLDAARELIAEADAADEVPDAAQADRVIRDWWSRQRG